MKNYTILLLDADQTLLDFSAAERFAIEKTCEKFGIPFSDEVGEKYSEINLSLWKKLEKGEIDRSQVKLRRFEEFAVFMDSSADPREMGLFYESTLATCGILLPGAMDACRTLSEKYKLYLVTNGLLHVQKSRLALSGILPFFSGCFISEETGFAKPDRRFFDFVLRSIGNPNKREVCVIGDSLSSDIQGGVNASLDTCLFGKAEKNCSPVPTYRAENFEELLKLFL